MGFFPSLQYARVTRREEGMPQGPPGPDHGGGRYKLIWRKHLDISLVASGKTLAPCYSFFPPLFSHGTAGVGNKEGR